MNDNKHYRNYDQAVDLFPLSLTTPGCMENERLLRRDLSKIDSPFFPILDIGSGTGRTVIAIAESIPKVDIFAIEPCTAMRAVLTHQVLQRADLRNRVTLFSEPVDRLRLPENLGAVVAYGIIGHLDAPVRKKLWKAIIPRLPKGAPIFIELMPFDKPMNFSEIPMGQVTIGRRLYKGVFSGKIEGENDLMCITTKWTVTEVEGGEETVIKASNLWHTFSFDDLAFETGLTAKKTSQSSGVLYV
ncbi:class I SAM-dependent methyltransferase [Desulfobacter sp.]|jgi:SAM-dependent methyltransferase|uniref:class I SAM-dependent methyltransferase n=1 Tax=Desulfobacter sp. TaxID=2294 RepID=UPI000E812023|nr:class I SAM-dependent methyltransferase [Desulfobacter sp.]HBT89713.1 class I SAM-dependent methyltransferase [Desulfobacter sp.]